MKQVIIEMMDNCKGRHEAVAAFLGLNITQFNNRLYQSNGQRFTEAQLLAVQGEYGLTNYTDEICRLTGGTFRKHLPVSEVGNVELWDLQQKSATSRAKVQLALTEALIDGSFSVEEIEVVRKLQALAVRDEHAVVEANIAVHSK